MSGCVEDLIKPFNADLYLPGEVDASDAAGDGDSIEEGDGDTGTHDGDADAGEVTQDCSHLDGPCSVGVSTDAGCVAEPNGARMCDDGDPCTTGDQCVGTACSGEPKVCDDGIACTSDACNAQTGECTVDTTGCPCAVDTDCDDGEPCTDDVCKADNSCFHAARPDGESCDDGLPCTTGDMCAAGVCSGSALECNDGIDCTTDSCDPLTGSCSYDALGCECSEASDCDDGDPCTEDSCNAASLSCTASPLPEGGACTDASTGVVGSCVAGACAGVQQVATGWEHSCALIPAGEVTCWGGNQRGQLGIGTMASTGPNMAIGDGEPTGEMPPTPVNLGQPAKLIAAGFYHSCALLEDGSIRCWGAGQAGQLGDGSTEDSPEPGGAVPLPPASMIAAGYDVTCAVVSGDVYCWGSNSQRILGDEDLTMSSSQPVLIGGIDDPVTDLSMGQTHACVVRGAFPACWGVGNFGQLGTGEPIELLPTLVEGLASPVQRVAAGFQHTCMLETDGDVKCWGNTGAGDEIWTVPFDAVPLPQQALAVVAGHLSCALLQNGQVYCWGHNHQGQLGGGTKSDSSVPLQPTVGEGVLALSARYAHVCSVLQSGRVRCWGWNDAGQLGIENKEAIGDGEGEMPPPFVNLQGSAGSLCFESSQCDSDNCDSATNGCSP